MVYSPYGGDTTDKLILLFPILLVLFVILVVYGFYLSVKRQNKARRERLEKDNLISELSARVTELESKVGNN